MCTSSNSSLVHKLPEGGPQPPSQFTYPFCYTPHPLCIQAAELVKAEIKRNPDWEEEISRGKMLGVLVVEGGFLAAFSGTLCGKGTLPYFVPPVFDLHQPDCHFQKEEKEITQLIRRARELEQSPEAIAIKEKIARAEKQAAEDIAAAKLKMTQAKERRDNLRETCGQTDEMIRESQFLKAELHRTKLAWKEELDKLHREEKFIGQNSQTLKEEYASRSAALQQWLFHEFSFLNARGERKDLKDIFGQLEPPAGSGECCAPKLLQYAYYHKLKPLCMAEFWLGESPKGELRVSGNYYPACQAKCKPILGWMLQGLDVERNPIEEQNKAVAKELKILYKDEDIIVLSKPTGMLSVPGKDDVPSVKSEIQRRYPNISGPIIVHRLDMDTSGLMVIAMNEEAYHSLQEQFAKHTTIKRYIAKVEHDIEQKPEGIIQLPLRGNPNDRPRQMVDFEHGKKAITRYKVESHRLIHLWPETGRTHQLRVHLASPFGLDNPIIGDRLYGKPDKRLCLHADFLQFKHPTTGKTVTFADESYDF